ncbi:hypothetical protein [Nocardia wallacei]|uniref:Uncharacterized protein n=1 Tax=Nocardia wallacei TaxID=480035 RepID=A0A7G1KT50_9NOCA|nr:hypothetical protein [Nocardia wallacei]BCK58428.1 hypothetical protein NWFMUON74_62000 [Nocardia wallacei]
MTASDRISKVLARLAGAYAAKQATGEDQEIGRAGRAPSRSEAYDRAVAEEHAALQARNALFVEMVGDTDVAPIELVKQFGMSGREAASLVRTARHGEPRLQRWLFGDDFGDGVVWTSESPESDVR